MSELEKITFNDGCSVTGKVLSHDGKLMKVKLNNGNIALFSVFDVKNRKSMKPKKSEQLSKVNKNEKESEG